MIVAQGENVALFGRNWMKELRLNWNEVFGIMRDSSSAYSSATTDRPFTPPEGLSPQMKAILEKYHRVFDGKQGVIKGYKANIRLKPDSQPIFWRARPVPYSLTDKVGEELDRLEQAGIIKKVDRSEWASPLVIVTKGDGSLRLCGDYKVSVNKYIEDNEEYPLPTAEDIFATLAGGTKFSKIHLTSAYLQLELDEESKEYLTINTHKGLYQFQRLSFGVKSAPWIFQKTMDQILTGTRKTKCSIDDILTQGHGNPEHYGNIEEVLKRLDEHNVKAKLAKCEFDRDSLDYVGHNVDAEGIHPTNEHVEDIQKLRAPENVSELKALLGLINYYAKFLPFRADLLSPWHQLLKKEVPWNWSKKCEEALIVVKRLLSSSPVLVHYDPTLPITLASDANPYGIGAVLSHVMPNGDERPVAFASRTLKPAEKNYAQIEKEALSIVFGVKKFH